LIASRVPSTSATDAVGDDGQDVIQLKPNGGFMQFRSSLFTWSCFLVLVACGSPQAMAADEFSLVERITEYVKPAIESREIIGLTIGVIDAREGTPEFKLPEGAEAPKIDGAKTLVLGFGRANDAREGAPRSDTLFEIGSITKVFTSLILAEMVERKLLKYDDPVETLLPAGTTAPARGERKITLIDLATHTSALPRMPANFAPADPNNPFADYTEKQLYEALAALKLKREPGKEYDYSNLGVGLLGHALALKAGKTYEQLVIDEIAKPLGMNSTVISRDESLLARSASGHDADGKASGDWDLATLAGAGALRSTSGDMLRFLAAEMGVIDTPLAPAMKASQEIRLATKVPPGSIACGWHVALDGALRWHNGQTGSFKSFCGFDRGRKIGVVVLSNTTSQFVDTIGVGVLKILIGSKPGALNIKQVAKIDPAGLDALVGKYELVPLTQIFTITREGDELWAQLTGQPKARIFPTSPTEFFYRLVDAQLTFEKDDKGDIVRVVLHQGGRDLPARKLKE